MAPRPPSTRMLLPDDRAIVRHLRTQVETGRIMRPPTRLRRRLVHADELEPNVPEEAESITEHHATPGSKGGVALTRRTVSGTRKKVQLKKYWLPATFLVIAVFLAIVGLVW